MFFDSSLFLQDIEEAGAVIHLPKGLDVGLNEGTPGSKVIEGLELVSVLLTLSAEG